VTLSWAAHIAASHKCKVLTFQWPSSRSEPNKASDITRQKNANDDDKGITFIMNIAHAHWILDVVSIEQVPVRWLLSEPISEHLNVDPIPGMGNSGYSELIKSAANEGLIRLLPNEDLAGQYDAQYRPTASTPLAMRSSSDSMRIGLTEQGGIEWERLARPQWDKFLYFSVSSVSSDVNDCRITSVLASRDKILVIAYLGWFDMLENIDVSWGSLILEKCHPFSATYWKSLSDVHRATLSGIRKPTARRAPSTIRKWQLSLDEWRIRPWQRPDWPTSPDVT
jgi:hypothetical protein